QVQSLAQAAALAARSDQLIDQLTYAESELRASRDEIAATISNIADGVAAQDRDGKIVYANEPAAEMFGFESAEELIGARFKEVVDRMEIRDEFGNPFDPEQMPSRRALRGEERPEALLRYVVKATGKEWWTLVKARAIFDDEGRPTTAISVIEDLTEHRRGELAQRFLADAGKALNEPGDLTATVLQIAGSCVPAIADWCAIDLIESDGRLMRRAVLPDVGESPDEAPSVSLNVTATGVPELFGAEWGSDIGDALNAGDAGDAMHSSIVAPLTVQGKPIGAIALALSREGTRFTEYDLETVLELGRRAGVAIASTRDQDDRARVLNTLSTSLLPRQLPSFEGLKIATRFRPAEVIAEVSGDFFDAFEMVDGSVALVIGDVCGKGPEAAALTALARYTIRADAMRESEPSAILRTLNSALVGQVTDDRFCTVALARVRSNGNGGRVIDVASGGHPLPILSGPDGARPIGHSGTLLGVVSDPALETHTAEFTAGTSLVLYTDGLASGSTTDDVGFALGLLDGLNGRPADELASAIDAAAREAAKGPTRDDVAILVAQAS
ncbi:MAG: SpoIIE family protein phosphatase, partial [Solirubrobacterales bacterium]